jgi:cell division protein FtsB
MDETFNNRLRMHEKGRARPSGRLILTIGTIAFLLGIVLTAWAGWRAGYIDFSRDSGAASQAVAMPAEQAVAIPSASPSSEEVNEAAVQAVQAVEQVERQQGGLDQRVAGLEQRISRLDIQAEAAAGNAARAEGLLIAFATRRALERGDPLGYLGDQLRVRFGQAQPAAVRTIIENAGQPVTLDELIARLDGLSDPLKAAPRNESTLDAVRRELGSLFTIRREDTPSPQPDRRFNRAHRLLESGRVELAVQEVEKLPGAAEADAWIADARRYAAVQQALDQIESAAVLEPQRLRDGQGNQVE